LREVSEKGKKMKNYDLYFIKNKATQKTFYTSLNECIKLKKIWGNNSSDILGVIVFENGLKFEILN
jgi:hypothetical protein